MILKRTTCLGNVAHQKGNQSEKQKQSNVYIKLNKEVENFLKTDRFCV